MCNSNMNYLFVFGGEEREIGGEVVLVSFCVADDRQTSHLAVNTVTATRLDLQLDVAVVLNRNQKYFV